MERFASSPCGSWQFTHAGTMCHVSTWGEYPAVTMFARVWLTTVATEGVGLPSWQFAALYEQLN